MIIAGLIFNLRIREFPMNKYFLEKSKGNLLFPLSSMKSSPHFLPHLHIVDRDMYTEYSIVLDRLEKNSRLSACRRHWRLSNNSKDITLPFFDQSSTLQNTADYGMKI